MGIGELYSEIAALLLTQVGLRFLGSASIESRTYKEEMPTWTPDWSFQDHRAFFRQAFPPKASAGTMAEHLISRDKRFLILKGLFVDSVALLCAPFQPMPPDLTPTQS